MRALIRGEEVIAEPFSQWVESHLNWMIGAEKDSDGNPIAGDGWALINDYVPPAEIEHDGHIPVIVEETTTETTPAESEYVEVNGIRYYRR